MAIKISMMKKLFLGLLFVFSCSACTNVDKDENYIQSVRSFYQTLFKNPKALSISIGFIDHDVSNRKALTLGLSEDKLSEVVANASVVDDGSEMCKLVILSFADNNHVYFEVNRDDEHDINAIWLTNGKNIDGPSLLMRPCIAKGDNNMIYANPSSESAVVSPMKENTLFFFSPINSSDWLALYNDKKEELIGYIRINDILTFEMFPDSMKERAKGQINGC